MHATPAILTAAALTLAATVAAHEDHPPLAHDGPHPAGDPRTLVELPAPLEARLLAAMGDHRAALQEIKEALAATDYGRAADIAEERLGLSSRERHTSPAMAGHMPEEMQARGTAMHRAASAFARAAREAGAGGETRPALAALARVNAHCVACHAAYRVR